MKTYNIFLASSNDLKADREQFRIFISGKNDGWIKKGAYLKPVIWENFLDCISKEGLQSEYNKAIKDCHIFVLLYSTKVGKFTEEEFEAAFGEFKEANKPRIYTYFKDVDISISSIKQEEIKSLWAFQEKLKKLEHYPTNCKNTHDFLLKFSQQLDILADQDFFSFNEKEAFEIVKERLNTKNLDSSQLDLMELSTIGLDIKGYTWKIQNANDEVPPNVIMSINNINKRIDYYQSEDFQHEDVIKLEFTANFKKDPTGSEQYKKLKEFVEHKKGSFELTKELESLTIWSKNRIILKATSSDILLLKIKPTDSVKKNRAIALKEPSSALEIQIEVYEWIEDEILHIESNPKTRSVITFNFTLNIKTHESKIDLYANPENILDLATEELVYNFFSSIKNTLSVYKYESGIKKPYFDITIDNRLPSANSEYLDFLQNLREIENILGLTAEYPLPHIQMSDLINIKNLHKKLIGKNYRGSGSADIKLNEDITPDFFVDKQIQLVSPLKEIEILSKTYPLEDFEIIVDGCVSKITKNENKDTYHIEIIKAVEFIQKKETNQQKNVVS